jgi:hypothetical protein
MGYSASASIVIHVAYRLNVPVGTEGQLFARPVFKWAELEQVAYLYNRDIDAALATVAQRRKERAAMLDDLDLGELRSFSVSEEDAHAAIDRLAVCDVCGCIGDASRTKRGEVNQTDGTVPLICDKHWPED